MTRARPVRNMQRTRPVIRIRTISVATFALASCVLHSAIAGSALRAQTVHPQSAVIPPSTMVLPAASFYAAPAALTTPSVSSARSGSSTPGASSIRRLKRGDAAFLASLAVPGAGQYMLEQQRWIPYAALEAWAWIRYLDRRSNARALSHRYKDFAWDVARRVSVGARRDSTFPYYETLIHETSSGAFDSQPAVPGVQPEFDTLTYNGRQWKLAQSVFIPQGSSGDPGAPGYDAALEYYMGRAIPEQYAFAWNTGRLEQQVYVNIINESDAAYRDATRLLGVILANHLTSAVDALISARLRSAGTNVRVETGLTPGRKGAGGGPPVRLDVQLHYAW